MHALTLDHLSEGRLILGLGVSGPQVVEGWYGQPFAKPLARTREYIDIVRQVLARKHPVTGAGPHYTIPYPPLKPITHPLRPDIPIYLGAEGPKNVAMAAEICDGWLPLYYSPDREDVYAEAIANRPENFEIMYPMKVQITDDLDAGRLEIKKDLALYVGGMGAKDRNFHNELVIRLGYGEAAAEIQELYLDGKKAQAVAAVPDELVDDIALVGPKDRIKQRLAAWDDSAVTSLLVWPKTNEDLYTFAELVLG